MSDTIHSMSADFEIDQAAYKDVMEEELVDHLESVEEEGEKWSDKNITDKAFRELLTQFKEFNLKEESSLELFENEVMDEVASASIKY